ASRVPAQSGGRESVLKEAGGKVLRSWRHCRESAWRGNVHDGWSTVRNMIPRMRLDGRGKSSTTQQMFATLNTGPFTAARRPSDESIFHDDPDKTCGRPKPTRQNWLYHCGTACGHLDHGDADGPVAARLGKVT